MRIRSSCRDPQTPNKHMCPGTGEALTRAGGVLGAEVPGVVVVALVALVAVAVATVLAIVKATGEVAVVETANAGKVRAREAEPADAEEPEGLRDTYRGRRIHLKRLKAPAKWLIWVAIAQ